MNDGVDNPPIVEEKKQLRIGSSGIVPYLTEFLKIFIVAAAIIVPIRLFLVQPFYVKGASMEPNFYEGEYLIIDKLTPRIVDYKRGEVIVFRYPRNENRFLIKRVIALPGETVIIERDSIKIVNEEHPKGFVLNEESYRPYELRPEPIRETLGEDEYFVLGDNRPVSFDSERFGPVENDQIVGRVVLRGLPLNRASILKSPSYTE